MKIENKEESGASAPRSYGLGVGRTAEVAHAPSKSREARNSGEPVKTRIKGQDSFDSMPLHDRQMHCIARGHLAVPQHYKPESSMCT